jgi:hypothetical protein
MSQLENLKRNGILVLGMHRSGTSALTGVLAALGVAPPKTLIRGDEWNSRGYWESARMNHFNERLLSKLGSTWDDWSYFDIDRMTLEETALFLRELTALLKSEFGVEKTFAIKDPRICRMVPFWLKAMREFDISPSVILAVRHPAEVALSLQRRDQMPCVDGIMLWMRSILDSEYSSRDVCRNFTRYEDLLNAWRPTVERIHVDLSILWPISLDQAAEKIEDFVSRDLKHNNSRSLQEVNLPVALSNSVSEVWEIVSLLAGDVSRQENYFSRLDEIRREFDAYCHTIAGDREGQSVKKYEQLNFGRLQERNGTGLRQLGNWINNKRRYWTARCLLLVAPMFSLKYAERVRRRLERYEAQGKIERKTFS